LKVCCPAQARARAPSAHRWASARVISRVARPCHAVAARDSGWRHGRRREGNTPASLDGALYICAKYRRYRRSRWLSSVLVGRRWFRRASSVQQLIIASSSAQPSCKPSIRGSSSLHTPLLPLRRPRARYRSAATSHRHNGQRRSRSSQQPGRP
jgi:hypothetical protein